MFKNFYFHSVILILMITVLFILFYFDENKNETIKQLQEEKQILLSEINACQIQSGDLNDILTTLTQNNEERETFHVQRGESLSLLLSNQNVSELNIYHIVSKIEEIHPRLLILRENQKYRIIHNEEQLIYFDLFINNNKAIRIDFSFNPIEVYEHNATIEIKHKYIHGTINNSLYVDGLNSGLTQRQIEEFTSIFAWDIDFSRNINQGDNFNVVFEEYYIDGHKIGRGNIIGAHIQTMNNNYYAIGVLQNNAIRYFNLTGESIEKAFLKSPVQAGRITSRFTYSRMHPILKVNRPHRGVDYGGALNTPIMATADGIITKIRQEHAYGNVIMIDHGQNHETLYAHLNRFNSELKLGDEVKQGQIIGYMGTTGLSTGIHLHYELRVNNQHQDPLTIDLPNGEKPENLDVFNENKEYLFNYWQDNLYL